MTLTRPWRTAMTIALVILLAASQAGCAAPRSPSPAPPPAATVAGAPASPSETPSAPTPTEASPTSLPPTATALPPTPTAIPVDPLDLISQESLFASLTDLTSIRPYAGWRSAGTQGEVEAFDYVGGRLGRLAYLQSLGLEIERESYRIFLSTELWETRLRLTVDGRQVEVPVNGMHGYRDDVARALCFDSDGRLNDAERNPVMAEGPVVLVRSLDDLRTLRPEDVKGKVLFLDYAAVDDTVVKPEEAGALAWVLLAAEPAGMVLVTHFSNEQGESHGTRAGELGAVTMVKTAPTPPVLYTRLEDLAPAGVASWEDLSRVQAAQLTWDADVFSPARSGNLVARIPGQDPSRAVVLGAHIDSPNNPGALDDGSGSVALLEVARVLDAARVQPPVDLYLAWFGSEEPVVYGSAVFAATHQDLLDRTLAMLQLDCLTRPVKGFSPQLSAITWSYGHFGDERLAWPDYLAQAAARRGVKVLAKNAYKLESDNTGFSGFGVPNANFIYADYEAMQEAGIHYVGHLHDPYDTVELTRDVAGALVQSAQVALLAALETGPEAPDLRVAPAPKGRAVFVASHTEAAHMGPAGFTELGMALTWEGLDVDAVPYGRPVTVADLEGADLVVVLPVIDYPNADGDLSLYDEAWSEAEIAALEAYAASGGLLVLTNSARRLKTSNGAYDANEDWGDANALATRFGVTFRSGKLSGTQAAVEGTDPLLAGVTALELVEGNGVPFDVSAGQVLARSGGQPVGAVVAHGERGGQVLILADVGILGADNDGRGNLAFWRNLGRLASSR